VFQQAAEGETASTAVDESVLSSRDNDTVKKRNF